MTKITEDHVPGLLHAAEVAKTLEYAFLSERLTVMAQEAVSTTTSNKYRSELYDEVSALAKSMGYQNCTSALHVLHKLGPLLKNLQEAEAFIQVCKNDSTSIETGAFRDAREWQQEAVEKLATHLNQTGFQHKAEE